MAEAEREFAKVEAAGNDLVLIDARQHELAEPEACARAVCDRRSGVGGDGLMLLSPSDRAQALVRMFNPDGTEDFCGNGMRCVAAYLAPHGGDALLETPRGLHRARVELQGDDEYEVTVEIGVPALLPAQVPVRMDGENAIDYPLEVHGKTWRASSVSTGTTHTVIFVGEPLAGADFLRYGPLIEHHALFPERTSVLWCVARSSDMVEMRIWERGVGETLACGTGTCAVAVVGRALGITGGRVEVRSAGGAMVAEWDGKGPVKLTGPARILFRGRLSPELGIAPRH